MRVALVGPVYPYRGGIAHYNALLARALAEHHEVRLFSYRRQYPRWLYPGRSDKDESKLALSFPAEFCLEPFWPPSWLHTCARIDRFAPELTIIHWWVPFWATCTGSVLRVLRRRGLRTVCICHNILPHERRPLDKLMVKWALEPATWLLVHSHADKRVAESLIAGAKVFVHPHPSYSQLVQGLPSKEQARAALGIHERRVLLFFGLVRPYKGLRYLLEALSLLPDKEDLRLIVAGEFWEPLASYQDLAASLGIDSIVTWEPRYIPNEELPLYFAACDAVVLPYTQASQSGVIQLAFGAGRPVITTNVGGLPEVVEEGRTGLLVPPGDAQALAECIAQFFANRFGPVLEERLRQHASSFSWAHMVRVLENLDTATQAIAQL